ncbi:MAG: hypothetical protein KJ646_04395 [Nanoarchaeota archaeon]|nr:hypothetical protein [Nanoarchaeota archaeon]
MYPTQHLILGAIFSLLLLFLFPQIGFLGASIIILSTVLIDVDHYVYYTFKKKDLSLKNSYNWFIRKVTTFNNLPRKQRNKFYIAFCCLHGLEVLLILLIFSTMFQYFFFIFIGFSFHLLLDLVSETRHRDRIDRISLIYDFFKFKKLKFI